MPEEIAYLEHPSDVLAHAVGLSGQGRGFSLVTSVGIKGGAAREVGSLALVEDGGRMVGYLSNGCIDRDIRLHALAALQSGDKHLLRYGNGSPIMDLMLPCGGTLDVLIDPDPDRDGINLAYRALTDREPASLTFHLPDKGAGDVTFRYLPKPRLVLAGRGAVFRATAALGKSAGFEVVLLTPDTDDIAATASLCDRSPVHLMSPEKSVDLDALDEYSAFLTLFHDHEWEPGLLQAALARPARFLGCLGSTRTHALRLERLARMGVGPEDLQRVKGPIGLVPALREASLIAISAIAEIVTTLPASIREVGAETENDTSAVLEAALEAGLRT